MATLAEIYGKVQAAVYQVSELENRLETLKEDYQVKIDEENKIRKKQFGTGSIGMIISLVAIVIGFVNGAIIGAIIAFFVHAIICVIIDSLFFEKKRNRKADIIHEGQVVPVEKEIAKTENKIKSLYSTKVMHFYITHFPPECQSLEALDYFVEAIYYKRANSEKELFALWENELYKRKMLNMQEEQIRQIKQVANNQQKQTETMSEQTRLIEKQLVQQKKLSKQVRYGNVVSTLDYLDND